ncbi:leucine-rich repeat protein [Perkinsela sp. CCAP 1560/4]|nr:leucine-rich repeat protein [Perkinsela sp. CCAP 1560/4]|eukprot:KNH08237.1 leucine-rich repeat protein [Perkinsela sp. CCAP 1560/4]
MLILCILAIVLFWAWQLGRIGLWVFGLYSTIQGRQSPFDVDRLSSQEQMELMIMNVAGKGQFYEEDYKYLDACKWKGVDCDIFGTVNTITWNNHSIDLESGYIELSRIPDMVGYFNVQNQGFHGTLIMKTLPRKLIELYLTSNYFHGTIELSQLPPSIKDVYLGDNQFTGTINLRNIPESVEFLILRKNRFLQKTVVLDDTIPHKKIKRIDLSENQIDEIVDSMGLTIHKECIDIRPK